MLSVSAWFSSRMLGSTTRKRSRVVLLTTAHLAQVLLNGLPLHHDLRDLRLLTLESFHIEPAHSYLSLDSVFRVPFYLLQILPRFLSLGPQPKLNSPAASSTATSSWGSPLAIASGRPSTGSDRSARRDRFRTRGPEARADPTRGRTWSRPGSGPRAPSPPPN